MTAMNVSALIVATPIVKAVLMALAALGVSALLTGLVRRYLLARTILDIPNARSSHTVPTPRGGGVAIVSAFFLCIVALYTTGQLAREAFMALLGGGLLVAVVGWLDDRYSLSIGIRLAAQAAAALWALWWMPDMATIYITEQWYVSGLWGMLISFLWILWMINLYNFMDGIDGQAGGEAVVVLAVAGILLLEQVNPGFVAGNGTGSGTGIGNGVGTSLGLGLACLGLAGSAGGFLIWNWPPAQIFMGDVGSGFLGYAIAVLALFSAFTPPALSAGPQFLPVVAWLILLAVFIIDATLTLLTRMWAGQKWWQPHREHIYQKVVISGYTHRQVTLAVIIVDAGLAGAVVLGLAGLVRWEYLLVGVYAVMITAYFILANRFEVP